MGYQHATRRFAEKEYIVSCDWAHEPVTCEYHLIRQIARKTLLNAESSPAGGIVDNGFRARHQVQVLPVDGSSRDDTCGLHHASHLTGRW